jgi:predicted SnoaL-like aldol condensation-catalyzing enzyme
MKSSNTKFFNFFVVMVAALFLTACSTVAPTASGADLSLQEANKRMALAFYRSGISTEERDAMIHDGYIQHNPAAVKFANEKGITAKQAFPLWMAKILAGSSEGPQSTGPRPPAGKQAYMAIAEGDKVFLMHQRFAQDPNEAPGTFYEYFSWGMFAFKDGLIWEHWDGNIIHPE